VKSHLYVTENFTGGQRPPVLWRQPIGLMSPKNQKNHPKYNIKEVGSFMVGKLA
jgi:hypothetical protein